MPERPGKDAGKFKRLSDIKRQTWAYNAILPNVVFEGGFTSKTGPKENQERMSAALDKLSPNITLDLFKLPMELRNAVFGEILGPVRGLGKPQHKNHSPIEVARRVTNSSSPDDIGDPADNSDDFSDNNSSKYLLEIEDRREFFNYISREDYYQLESCAQRIRKMEKKPKETLDEFLRYFFDNTVLELHTELDWDLFEITALPSKPGPFSQEKRFAMPPMQLESHKWLKFRRDLHPYIKNISLDVGDYFISCQFINLCQCISRTLVLDTLTLWTTIYRETADEIHSRRGDPTHIAWTGVPDAIRRLVVRKSLEVHVVVCEHQETGEWVRGKELMAERKVLGDLLHDILLPDTLRNPIQEDGDEYLGISDLFEIGPLLGKRKRSDDGDSD